MPTTRKPSVPAKDSKPHRSASATRKTPARVPSAPAPIVECDAAARDREIAEVAYRNWLERAEGPGSPLEDWLRAEIEVCFGSKKG